ncbi:hypothetical protein KP509_04G063200 [Ceratopteris richardii]|uniref:Beta-glucosidase n=1 Tax=Ceratopteris richardii TaxID=49495 RepID=A0A8T2UW38_CERRI|nr:hypothetical protein KP509_04G063200 [Ceratopteris richardii]KAH7439472.1 hypothetical protein KP509_04G063200 [Ceratopteris richardii]
MHIDSQYHGLEYIQVRTVVKMHFPVSLTSWLRPFELAGDNKHVNYPRIDHYNAVIDALLSNGILEFLSFNETRLVYQDIQCENFWRICTSVILHFLNNICDVQFPGIEPYVTLYHWDLPQALQDEYGGWLSENIIDDFLSFADTCFASFGDRVKHWITINEPYSFVSQGYGGFGTQAPGRCSIRVKCSEGDSKIEPYIAGHNVLMAHASVVALYREKYQAQQRGSIGICLDSRWYEPLNETSVDDLEASRRALDFHLGWFLGPLVFGDYPSSM